MGGGGVSVCMCKGQRRIESQRIKFGLQPAPRRMRAADPMSSPRPYEKEKERGRREEGKKIKEEKK